MASFWLVVWSSEDLGRAFGRERKPTEQRAPLHVKSSPGGFGMLLLEGQGIRGKRSSKRHHDASGLRLEV